MSEEQRVVVTDVKIHFLCLVVLQIKTALASIPALLILLFLGGLAVAVFTGMHTPPPTP
ncbi:MAG: hypothetical protein ABJC66_17130 [Gammaproteobacteria bacterium]